MNRKLVWLLASLWTGVAGASFFEFIVPGGSPGDAVLTAFVITATVAPFVYALQAVGADHPLLVALAVTLPVGVLYYALFAWVGLPVWFALIGVATYALPVGVFAALSTWTWDYWHRYEVTAS